MGKNKKALDDYRDWVMATMVEEGGGNCPEIVARGVALFSQDADWCQRVLMEDLYHLFYRVTQGVLTEGRRVFTRNSSESILNNTSAGAWDLCAVFERVDGQYIPLANMTADMLIAAGEERVKKGLAEVARGKARIKLGRMLRERAGSEGATVCDVFEIEEAMAIIKDEHGDLAIVGGVATRGTDRKSVV